MAQEKQIWEVIKDAGFEPIENKTIIVKYAPENLSEKIVNFLSWEFYVLQLCENEMLLIPFSQLTLALKKEVALQIPLTSIKSVEIVEEVMNYNIKLETEDGKITLTTQQKELSGWRSSGVLAINYKKLGFVWENWHEKNFDETLEALKNLNI